MDKQSILDMAQGAIKERVDYEMAKVIDNILDQNTNPTKKRTVTLTIGLTPDSERQQVSISVVAKSKLEPTNPVSTALYITGDKDGAVTAVEMVPQIPGQMDMSSQEQEEPSVLRLVKGAS
jgi:hypothetical protein